MRVALERSLNSHSMFCACCSEAVDQPHWYRHALSGEEAASSANISTHPGPMLAIKNRDRATHSSHGPSTVPRHSCEPARWMRCPSRGAQLRGLQLRWMCAVRAYYPLAHKNLTRRSDSTQQRALRHLVTGLSSVTVESCLDACAAGNYALAGLEYSHDESALSYLQ